MAHVVYREPRRVPLSTLTSCSTAAHRQPICALLSAFFLAIVAVLCCSALSPCCSVRLPTTHIYILLQVRLSCYCKFPDISDTLFPFAAMAMQIITKDIDAGGVPAQNLVTEDFYVGGVRGIKLSAALQGPVAGLDGPDDCILHERVGEKVTLKIMVSNMHSYRPNSNLTFYHRSKVMKTLGS